MKKLYIILAILAVVSDARAQKVGVALYGRAVNVVNTTFSSNTKTFSPVVSAGVGISRKTLYLEAGVFRNMRFSKTGLVLFGQRVVHSVSLGTNSKLVLSIVAEGGVVPKGMNHGQTTSPSAVMAGGSVVFVRPLGAGFALAVPFVHGITRDNVTGSLGTTHRLIFNIAKQF